jgi:hypothetical protein
LRRLPDGPRRKPTEAASAKQGGHGDHWGCVLRAAEEGDLLRFLGGVVQEAEHVEVFGGRAVSAGMAVHSAGDRLCACLLVVDDQVVTAYPEVRDGPVWPVTVKHVVPWANGVEGQITGECYGALVNFFDTHYYANSGRYTVGETYEFRMGALAYRLGPAADLEAESDLGAKVSFKGAHAYMPASTGNEGSDIDDYWFYSPLEAAPGRAQLAGRALDIYPVTVALPSQPGGGEFEMRLDLLAAPHVALPGTHEVEPGDDLDGFLWLQGYLSGDRR